MNAHFSSTEGRNVTLDVIWRMISWMSFWICSFVFAGLGALAGGASAGLRSPVSSLLDRRARDVQGVLLLPYCHSSHHGILDVDIKLPALQRLPAFLGDDGHNEARDVASQDPRCVPLVLAPLPPRRHSQGRLRTLHLSHDLLDVPLERLVRSGEEGEAVLFDHLEVFWRVDAALVEDAVGFLVVSFPCSSPPATQPTTVVRVPTCLRCTRRTLLPSWLSQTGLYSASSQSS